MCLLINRMFYRKSLPFFVRRFVTAPYRPELPPCEFRPMRKYNGLGIDEIRTIRNENLSPALTTYYSDNFLLYDGKMQWLFDSNGNRYLDMIGGIATVSVGHCHPKINAALKEQIDALWHTSNVYLHPKIHEFASKLVKLLPFNLRNVYFVNSGSEANDLALLIAKMHTKATEVISLKNCYHGMSGVTMDVTSINKFRYPIKLMSGVHCVMNPDVYKGHWGGCKCRDSPVQANRECECTSVDKCVASEQYVEEFRTNFDSVLSKRIGHLAAFIFEPIQGVGGVVQYPRNYIRNVCELVRERGGLVIADEVQTGFGRTGDNYWGFEMHDILPDIVTMAKGIGNGFPLAAVVTSKEIGDSLTEATHFNTFGGNALASTVGSTVLDIIKEEEYQLRSKTIGTHLLRRLAALREKFDIIGDVRGKGLMIGIELIEPKHLPKIRPLSEELLSGIWYLCRDLGLLIGKGGVDGNVLRLMPPMCITKEDADFTVDVLDYVFSDAVKKLR